jgi:hypothetical protein
MKQRSFCCRPKILHVRQIIIIIIIINNYHYYGVGVSYKGITFMRNLIKIGQLVQKWEGGSLDGLLPSHEEHSGLSLSPLLLLFFF